MVRRTIQPSLEADRNNTRKIVRIRKIPKPSCTHIDVDRVYGDFQCHCCLQVRGWVYACRQDALQDHRRSIPATVHEADMNERSIQRRELELLGMSRSVIETFEAGGYTPEQLEKLKAQKRRVHMTIRLQEMASGGPITADFHPPLEPLVDETSGPLPSHPHALNWSPSFSAPAKIDHDEADTLKMQLTRRVSDGANKLRKKKLPKTVAVKPPPLPPTQACNFMVCHLCRPYMRDRLPTSFDAVFANECKPMVGPALGYLPLMDANVMRGIGLRSNPPSSSKRPRPPFASPSPPSKDLSSHDGRSVKRRRGSTDEGRLSRFWSELEDTFGGQRADDAEGSSNSRVDFDESFRASLRRAIERMTRARERRQANRLPNRELFLRNPECVSPSSSAPNASNEKPLSSETSEDDVMLRKASATELPSRNDDDSLKTQLTDSSGEHRETANEVGEDDRVSGGVALTEDSVETNVPDIITQV